jgi:hypothetical protein
LGAAATSVFEREGISMFTEDCCAESFRADLSEEQLARLERLDAAAAAPTEVLPTPPARAARRLVGPERERFLAQRETR